MTDAATTPPADFKRFTRRKDLAEPSERAEPRSPTVYDWLVKLVFTYMCTRLLKLTDVYGSGL